MYESFECMKQFYWVWFLFNLEINFRKHKIKRKYHFDH